MEMNPMKAQGLQGVTKGKGTMTLKKTLTLILQVILLLSIPSLIIYYCCSNTSFHQSLQQFINSKSMFLFCNAILLFLARDSGVLGSSAAPVNDLYDELVVRRAKHRTVGINVEIEAVGLEKELEKGGEYLELVVVVGGKDQLDERELGVDELNKRCEEFIERVKRERRLEDLRLVIG